jgi:TolA-binding protein
MCAAATEPQDYERGLEAYRKSDYVVAGMYFQSILNDRGLRQFHPDALYHLTKINEHEGNFVAFFATASRFLGEYPYDMRVPEIFSVLIQKLIDKQAYVLAFDYSREYNYLISGDSLFEKLGHGLLQQGDNGLADSVFSLCTQTDTIKIIRAFLNHDYAARERIFKILENHFQNLYLAENYLLLGDTLSAYLAFLEIDQRELDDGALHKYAKIALHFDRAAAGVCAERLGRNKEYTRKALLIGALAGCRVNAKILPEDEEEQVLFLRACDLDTLEKEPPQELILMLDSMLNQTDDTVALMHEVRRQYRNDYYVDSLYCGALMRLGRYEDASRVISPYLKYCNTQAYVRKVLGIQHFAAKDYASAAKHIVISNYHSPFVHYMLAECLRMMGYEAGSLYEEVVSQTADSVLYYNALAGFVQDRYAAEDFQKVCTITPSELQEDTNLIKIYARSLARCGRKEAADSVHNEYFLMPDPVLLNYYGLYLIEKEKFTEAGRYFDSLFTNMNSISDDLYYNWALTSFLNNDMEMAKQRFIRYLDDHPKGLRLYDVLFKFATMNYLQENYDSAAYYYGLASEDEALRTDALRNQLISYKKDGDWLGVISVGERILASGTDMEKADIFFDIGYALLRAGRTKEAIENLVTAARMKSDPRFYYWVGEAYLTKGDFARAFYSYRKVIDLHAYDEMWVPTAQYKTGIVLELMDETDAARATYQRIVRERGVADPIGAEADIRLKGMEP